MQLKINTFGGIQPRQHPTLLADGMAVTAHNCRLKRGKLVPLREPLLVAGAPVFMENGLADIADARSMHVWRRHSPDAVPPFDFLLFPGVTWSAPGNIADDERTRLVVSGATGATFTDADGATHENTPVVYMRSPSTGSRLAPVPLAKNPLPAPLVSRVSTGELTDNRRFTRFFVTWVDEFGMESPVSEPSLVLREFTTADDWTITPSTDEGDVTTYTVSKGDERYTSSHVSGTPTTESTTITAISLFVDDDVEYMDGDTISFAPIGTTAFPAASVAVRVYKVVTGMTEGRIQFIKEVPRAELNAGAFGFVAAVKDEDAGEIMPEIEAPPPCLSCIHDVPGAFYCGFSKDMPKTVCFSDVDLLYSWPVAYRYDVADNIVALAVTSNSVFALTDGWPYVLSGTAPESMTVTKLAGPAACVSPLGVCVYRNAVFYASNAGLMMIANSADAGTVCQNLTDKQFTKDQWLALNPSSCIMGQFDGALFLYFTSADGTAHSGLTIDLMDDSRVSVTTHNEAATCLCVDNREDQLYFVREV